MARNKKIVLTEEDRALFQTAMRGVKPLKKSSVKIESPRPRPSKPIPKKRQPTIPDDDESGIEFSDHENLPTLASDTTIEFARSGVQHKMLRKIRQGQYNVEIILDLHGKTVDAARTALSEFLLFCQQNNLRHILIIHGKGRSHDKPILKNKLNHWLRQTNQVLAFCTAAAKHGRAGALYVLLRG